MALYGPEPLADHHSVDDFDSGVPLLDDWLKNRAAANQISGGSRTYVLCEERSVIAYYALASGALVPESALGRFRRNVPNPIPVAILGRLAVDKRYQLRGIGGALVRDASQRVIRAADEIGIRGIVVHAISEEARSFYLRLGFASSPADPMILMVTLLELRTASSETAGGHHTSP